jgi:hypothetical protein
MARVTGPIPGLLNQGTSSLTQTVNTPLLFDALYSGNPAAASYAAQQAAQLTYTPDTTITVTVYDKYYNFVGTLGDYKKLTVTWERNMTDTAVITLKQTDPLVSNVMNCWQTVVPITIQTGYLRWSGRVEYCDYAYKDGEYNVEVYCTSDYQWFDKIMVWPNPFLPIQVQFPSEALFIGPAITCIKTMIMENVFRLQSGLFEFIDNALSGDLDWEAWFGTLLESDGNLGEMLLTPIVVVGTDPLFDTSAWISLEGRMDKVSTLVSQALKDTGLLLTANLWLPGEPQPENLHLTLKAPTIVVDCKDMSGVTGPTGTFIDGLVEDVVDLQQSILGNVLAPFLNPGNEYAPEGINIAPKLGVNFTPPWVLFTDQPRGGLKEFHIIPHSPLAFTVIGGGKSPQWLNDLINELLEWLIDSIEIAIGFTGIPDDLLNGTFDDIVLAFQQIENFDRRQALGPYAFFEYFQQTGASAYTLDEWFSLIEAMWDSRGYNGIQLSFDDGYPYTIGKDIFVGALASFASTGLGLTGGTGSSSQGSTNLYTDYVERVTIADSPEQRRRATVMIGDGKSHDDPALKIERKLLSFEEAFQIITLSSNS